MQACCSNFAEMKIGTLLLFIAIALAVQYSEAGHDVFMGNFTTYTHSVRGSVYAIACNRYRIDCFYYDGGGPDVFFYYDSVTPRPSYRGKITRFWRAFNGMASGSANARFRTGWPYRKAQIIVDVPPDANVSTVKWLSVWCRSFRVDFGSVVFTKDAMQEASGWCVHDSSSSVPSPTATTMTKPTRMTSAATQTDTSTTDAMPTTTMTTTATPTPTPPPGPPIYCSPLADDYAICWQKNTEGESFTFVLCNSDVEIGQYMAFGFSKSKKRSQMVGSDAIVCAAMDAETWNISDYYLQAKRQCKQQRNRAKGVCPDTAFGATNDVSDKAAGFSDQGAWCTFKRNIKATDRKYDRTISVRKPQAIVWAVGPIQNGVIRKHTRRTTHRVQRIDFTGRNSTMCSGNDAISCCQMIIN